MRSLIIAAALLALPLALGGCSAIPGILGGTDVFTKAAESAGKVDNATAGNFAKGVAFYCKNLPGAGRGALRAHLNARPEMSGAKVAAWCPGDPPITLGP